MNLDSRIRDAVDETLTAAVDVDQGLVALRRTRRQRTATRAGSCVVVIALVVTGVLLRRHDTSPEPAPTPGPLRNGVILSLSLDEAVEQVDTERLPTLPAHARALGPFTFTPDGRELIYAWGGQVLARNLATGEDRGIMPCPTRLCLVMIDPTGTRVATAKADRITVRDLRTHERRHYDVGHVVVFTWSPDGRSLAVLTSTGTRLVLSYVDLETGLVRPLANPHGQTITYPALSPDGSQLAYLDIRSRRHGLPRVRLFVVSTSGQESAHLVRHVGRCACIRFFPAVTWSPKGDLVAVTMSGRPRRSQVGGAVFTVRPDGTEWKQLQDGYYQDRLAWQPVFRSAD